MTNLIYKYAPLDFHTISNLVNENIYFNNVDSFDDPTDAAFTILTGSDAIDVQDHSIENTKKLFDFIGEQYPNDDKAEQLFKTCHLLEKTLKEYIGIFCCSKHRVCQECSFPELKPLMLSHYSDKHRGIVIEYHCEKSDLLHIVDYQRNYKHIPYNELLKHFKPQLTSKKLEINKEIIKPLLLKFRDWQYQDEYRIFYDVTNKSISCSDLGIKARRIFFGYKAEEHCINAIEKILSNKAIEFYYLSPPQKNNEVKNIIIHSKYNKGSRENCENQCQY